MKITCISDMHGNFIEVPTCDVLVIAGDFSSHGDCRSLEVFKSDLLRYKDVAKDVVVICGNHDWIGEWNHELTKSEIESTGAKYLCDSGCEIDGIKFWGSPVQPRFFKWAFNRDRGPDIDQHWQMIPDDTEVLITHGPPYGVLDTVTSSYSKNNSEQVGCQDLANRIKNLKKLKLHVFGHIHEGYGMKIIDGVTYVNASSLNNRYIKTNAPITVEILKQELQNFKGDRDEN